MKMRFDSVNFPDFLCVTWYSNWYLINPTYTNRIHILNYQTHVCRKFVILFL